MEPVRLLRFEGLVFVLGLSALIAYRMLTGGINLRNLLSDGSGQMSAERVQLLMTTILVCFQYVHQAARAAGNSLPTVSPQTLGVFGLSGGVYAGVKALKLFRAR